VWNFIHRLPRYSHSQRHFTAASQPVSMSWCRAHFMDVRPDIAFFFLTCLGLEFVILPLWGALSDERPGLSFVRHSPVICLCVQLLFTFLSFTHLPYAYIYIYIYTHTHTHTHTHSL
jgi:hypothetical protein